MGAPNEILKNALNLSPKEKAELIDKLLSSMDIPDRGISELWSKESENRIDAYDRGEMKGIELEEVLKKYR